MEAFDFNVNSNHEGGDGKLPERLDFVTTTERTPPFEVIPQKKKRIFFPVSHLGKLSLLALSVVVAAKAGLALDHSILTFSQEQLWKLPPPVVATQEDLAARSDPRLKEIIAAPEEIIFTGTLSWLPQSSIGLRFSIPAQRSTVQAVRLETAQVVEELMEINLKMEKHEPSLAQIQPFPDQILPSPSEMPWLDIDPEMLKIVAEQSTTESFAQEQSEELPAETTSGPFSQDELVELVSMR
ncbi:MAG: hypothetical protein HW380_1761 [Magnetococcales bacterium]|nr:hypothetical protein [Magnetococcales bacterium]